MLMATVILFAPACLPKLTLKKKCNRTDSGLFINLFLLGFIYISSMDSAVWIILNQNTIIPYKKTSLLQLQETL